MRFVALLLLAGSVSSSQVITTIAGGQWLPPASGSQAKNAAIGWPTGIAFDSAGNLYIADQAMHIVECVSPAGQITVVAGNGNPGFSGDGASATAASLNTPTGVAVDSSGALYIADNANNRIRKVVNGVITTFAGNGIAGFAGDGGPASGAQIAYPFGLAVDTSGNLYFADNGNNRIREISNGVITTVAGSGVRGFAGDGQAPTAAQLAGPRAVALDSVGNLYIADTENNRIREISGGKITTIAGNGTAGLTGNNGPATAAELSGPWAVAVAPDGTVYIADTGNDDVRAVSGGTIRAFAGNGHNGALGDGGAPLNASLNQVLGLAVDGQGNVYIPQFYEGRVREVSQNVINTIAGNGAAGFAGDGGPAAAALMNTPSRMAFDGNGHMYVAEEGNNRVREISGGVINTVAGNGAGAFSGDGGPATSASLFRPWGVATDAAGNIYIADDFNNRLREVSNGVISTLAGTGVAAYAGDGGAATAAEIWNPVDVTYDGAGNVYFADLSNHRVRKISNGKITTVAGNGNSASSGDGGPATSAGLTPTGIALDSAGNLYIVDGPNNRVREVSGGVITTIAGNGTLGFSGDGGLAVSAELNQPNGVAIDGAGNIYIADTNNHRIRKISGGVISTVAGNGQARYGGDGAAATAASLYYPWAVLVDGAGNLYIADTNNNRIREVLASGPPVQASPATLNFSAVAGGAAPASQTITLSTATAGLAFSASAGASWLSVTPGAGSAPGLIQVAVNPANLSAGSYSSTVTIAVPGASPSTLTAGVKLTVTAAGAGNLSVSTPSVSLTSTAGGNAASQSLQVLNSGGGSLSFTASVAAGSSWLSFSAQSNTATAAAPATLVVTANPGSLSPGTYTGAIAFTAAGNTVTLPVTFSVSAPAGKLLISQNALTFQAVAQGGTPLPLVFSILNTGQGVLNWTAQATTLSGGNWLQLSSTSGNIQQPFLGFSTVNATVNPANLNAGTYYGNIQIKSPGAVNSPQSITVILNVLPAGANLGPQIYPNGLIFTGTAGNTPGSQDVLVGNTAAASNSYLSSTIGPVTFLPANAAIQANSPTTLHVYPDFSSLGPGITRGTITLQFADGSPSQAINVLMSVAPAGAGADFVAANSKAEPRSTSCPPGALNVVFRLPQPALGFAATVGQSLTLEASVSDSCGNQIVPGGQQPQLIVFFSNGDPQQSMSYLGNGVWQTSWRPVNAGALVTATVDALAQAGTAVVGGQAAVHGMVMQPSPGGAAPLVTSQGVVHAASDAAGIPIAPGELITVYGANLASGAANASSGLPLPLSSNGTQVFLGGAPLPILYTSSGQMNVQVPYTAPVNTTYQLSVQNGSSLSVPQTVTVAQASPGIFTSNEQGFGQGAIVRSDGVTLAQAGSPASIGETIVIYCTGLGATTPAVTAGQPAPSSTLAQTANPVTVTIGGVQAQVLFAGLTPGFAGLYQVNAIVPPGLTTGNSVPVTITVAGQSSQAGVTMAVH